MNSSESKASAKVVQLAEKLLPLILEECERFIDQVPLEAEQPSGLVAKFAPRRIPAEAKHNPFTKSGLPAQNAEVKTANEAGANTATAAIRERLNVIISEHAGDLGIVDNVALRAQITYAVTQAGFGNLTNYIGTGR